MATITKLSSGTWRVQIRRKGKYANQTFRRRGDAEQWARAMESRIDRGEPILSREKETKTFAGLIGLHLGDLAEVGKPLGRSKRASMEFLKARLGQFRPAELDRERLIAFGKERAKEGAGPVTVGIDLGYIKTVLSHAAAVHGVPVSIENVDLARIALTRLGLVGKGNERDRRPSDQEGLEGCVANVVEILWRRSPSMWICGRSGREVKADRADGLSQGFPAIDLPHLDLARCHQRPE